MINEASYGHNYPQALVYAVDWHLYKGQHNPKEGDPYMPLRAWITGFVLEDCESHLTMALTIFETGDVRDVIVIPRVCVLAYKNLEVGI